MQTLTQNIDIRQLDAFEGLTMGTDFGWSTGFEDGCEQVDMAGSAIFLMGSNEWDAYNEGYLAGLESQGIVDGPRYNAAFDLVQRATTAAAESNFWLLSFITAPASQEVAQPC